MRTTSHPTSRTSDNHPRQGTRRALALAAVVAVGFGVAACTDGATSAATPGPSASRAGTATSTASTLTGSTADGLVWMRAEEQLAHDVYTTLYDTWGTVTFSRIASSEAKHVDAVVRLLDRYGVSDPESDHELGVFADPQVQDLYDQLVADGSVSITAALEVGAAIEELDIRDLRDRTAAGPPADVAAVYANLERGSRNHLRAFVGQLSARGVTHEAVYLDADDVAAIVAGSVETGNGQGNGQGQGHGHGTGRGHGAGGGRGRGH